ncbi:hypothetical protein B0H16DRAFT_1716249 [Mycena metata]|uniref:Uncharacterized protein n=1 Tax=Mycena metata TaxID=1033252 RepID=A0AAD7JQC1_9AGAR|nr:hypothetical protein B0H16DRAFT_1716249 [Mycena metata]
MTAVGPLYTSTVCYADNPLNKAVCMDPVAKRRMLIATSDGHLKKDGPDAGRALRKDCDIHRRCARYDCSPAVWLAYDRDLFPIFRQLQTVTIGCDGPFLRPVHDFLAHLPTLQNLTLSGEYRRCTEFAPTPASPTFSPGLQSYTGPCEYIPLFLPGTACTCFALNASCTPADLVHALGPAPGPYTRAVTDLSLLLPLAPFCGLESPHALTHFPRLATLRLVISNAPLEDDPDIGDGVETVDAEALVDLPDILAAVLRAPTELAHAVIEWDLSCDVVGMLPALVDLRALVPQVRIVFERGVRAEGMDESTDTSGSESGSDESTEMEGVEKCKEVFFSLPLLDSDIYP